VCPSVFVCARVTLRVRVRVRVRARLLRSLMDENARLKNQLRDFDMLLGAERKKRL
jgi:hypothetical protein